MTQRTQPPMTDKEQLPAMVRPGVVNAVIEISAGTSDKLQYDPATDTFPVDLRRGKPRRIAFLPYPANYGFIPGTRMDKALGGDGDALDIFVLCAALPSGTVLEVEPIGIIELLDAGERDDKVIAIPADRSLLTMDVDDMQELPKAVREIMTLWLLNYDPEDGAKLLGWKGREAAMNAVERWLVRA